ncbi:hypothetical protein JCM11251_001430 [Rhodosporidiobolus azoricus]
MVSIAALTALVAASAASVSASPVEKRQNQAPVFPGAVGFTNPWPRGFNPTESRTGPCGGVTRGDSTNRTAFPLEGGDLALALSRDAYDITISYTTGTDDSGFQPLVPVVDYSFTGSKCYEAPDLSTLGVSAGDVLTFQLTYVASRLNSTFYQCAEVDVVDTASYVRPEFTCANVTASTQTRGQGGDSSSVADAAASTDAAAPSSTQGAGNGAGVLNPVSWIAGAGAVALAALAL